MLSLAHNLPEGQSPLLEPFWLSSKSSMTQAGEVEAASLSPTEALLSDSQMVPAYHVSPHILEPCL